MINENGFVLNLFHWDEYILYLLVHRMSHAYINYSTKRYPTSLISNSLSDDGATETDCLEVNWCLTSEEVGIIRGRQFW